MEFLAPEKSPDTYPNPDKLANYITKNHYVLTEKLGNNLVFDIIFNKVIGTYQQDWHDAFLKIIKTIDSNDDEDIKITENRRYLLQLQSNHLNQSHLFRAMIMRGFEMDDPEFLVYSIIARGELDKLQIMSRFYKIEDYPAVFDVALRYGRLQIIEYLIGDINAEPEYYGCIMDFENFVENDRYLYYRSMGLKPPSNEEAPIIGSSQDYIKSIRLIMDHYPHTLTVKTLQTWCDVVRNKYYLWDKANCSREVIQLIKSFVEERIPLTMDFREFNIDIFGSEWSDRTKIIEKCLALQERLDELMERYDRLVQMRFKI